jgi:hypothetical protein
MNDFVGQPIKLGQTILYPVRRKSDMHLCKATVISLNPLTVKSGRYSRTPKPERCIVIPGKVIIV